jgi:hypothetical protein
MGRRVPLHDNLQHILPRRQKIEQRHFAAIDYRMLPDAKEAAMPVAKAPRAPTFGECADMVFAAKSPSWRTAMHTRQWQASIARHAALIRDTPINEIDRQAVRDIATNLGLSWPICAKKRRLLASLPSFCF